MFIVNGNKNNIIVQSRESSIYKIFFACVLDRGLLFGINFGELNSSPIDERGGLVPM